MKRVKMTVEFILCDEFDNFSPVDLAEEMRCCLEDERDGLAKCGSAGVYDVAVEEIA